MRRGIFCKGVSLFVNNVPTHSSHIAIEESRRYSFEILPNQSFSPDLTSSNFFLLPERKTPCRVRNLSTRMTSFERSRWRWYPRGYGHELVAVVSRVRIQVPLKTRHLEGADIILNLLKLDVLPLEGS
ncbi:hypothetical protein TNCV_3325211 [Trichonephila clavipes]|nr:hypothetical protein TNCV_3325211 [Trichonephila clavipes]